MREKKLETINENSSPRNLVIKGNGRMGWSPVRNEKFREVCFSVCGVRNRSLVTNRLGIVEQELKMGNPERRANSIFENMIFP